MSIFQYPLEISGPASAEFQRVITLVDTGSTFTQVPSALLTRLGIRPTETVRFRLADGTTIRRPIGDAQVRVEGRTFSTTVVFGDDDAAALLGVYTLERPLLAVDPVGPTPGSHRRLNDVTRVPPPDWGRFGGVNATS